MCEIYDHILQKGEENGIEKGRAEGRKEGEKTGTLKLLVQLVKENILTLADAAKRADMTVENFVKETGLKI